MQNPVWITGVGAAVPDRVLTNEQIERGMPWLSTTAQWIVDHVGIRERRIVAPRESATDLAVLAAHQALERAGVALGEVELVLHATNTSEESFPAAASRVLTGLEKLTGETAHTGSLDVQQGCASFLGALRLAAAMIAAGEVEVALVTGADVASRMVDWTDRATCILLGDGACAAVLVGDQERLARGTVRLRYRAGYMQTDPSMADALRRDANLPHWNDPFLFLGRETIEGAAKDNFYGLAGARTFGVSYSPFFRMEGRDVYRFAKRIVPRRGYFEVLKRAGCFDALEGAIGDRMREMRSLDDVANSSERRAVLEACVPLFDLLIPHQANLYLVLEVAEQLALPLEKVYVNIARYGNTSAASVGIALEEALRIPAHYSTLPRRDAQGVIIQPGREVEAPSLGIGKKAMLLSFGAGNSWNYVFVEREGLEAN